MSPSALQPSCPLAVACALHHPTHASPGRPRWTFPPSSSSCPSPVQRAVQLAVILADVADSLCSHFSRNIVIYWQYSYLVLAFPRCGA
ncbi:hypothetical protein EXIGLDRAFT_520697 [Exidia glandulosa HHB12029]|uniref:Uncharacterized protein n=1 Tax=Exidia glandulosa HHB12029 TaxID=1314781 RepID=A0A166N0L6_EXIGL|nr:hypothetical protein EXIGLDRAFT_520697 [Exidia glandulosa HHB12029]